MVTALAASPAVRRLAATNFSKFVFINGRSQRANISTAFCAGFMPRRMPDPAQSNRLRYQIRQNWPRAQNSFLPGRSEASLLSLILPLAARGLKRSELECRLKNQFCALVGATNDSFRVTIFPFRLWWRQAPEGIATGAFVLAWRPAHSASILPRISFTSFAATVAAMPERSRTGLYSTTSAPTISPSTAWSRVMASRLDMPPGSR